MPQYKQYNDKTTNKKLWSWNGYIGIDPVTGKKKVSSAKGFKTKKDAQNDFLIKQLDLLKGKNITINCTLEELIRNFFEYKSDMVKESTIRSYKIQLKSMYSKNIILPTKQINTFTVAYCQTLYSKLKDNFKNPIIYLTILKNIFNFAVKQELLEKNPFSKVDTTEKQKIEEISKKYYEKDEILAFIKSTKQLNNPMFYYIFTLLIKTGMRQGEARALTWKDINFKESTITIDKTITSNKNYIEVIGDTPKTKSSNRIIAIDNNLASVLKEWKKLQSKSKNIIGLNFNNELVFHNNNFDILHPNVLRYAMKKACDIANIPYITVHGLRHTFVSLAIESGLQPIDIAHTTGHSDIKMIMEVYDSMTKERKNNVANIFGSYVGNL